MRSANVHVFNASGIPHREHLTSVIAVPAVRPIADVHLAVPTEINIGWQDLFHKLMRVRDCVASPLRLDCKGEDLAVLITAQEVAQEEVIAISIRKTKPWIKRKTSGTVREMFNRRQCPRWTHGICCVPLPPRVLLAPRPALIRALKRLVVHVPTSLAAFHDVDDARAIAAIRIVVAGEEITPLIEGQFLRISQRMREHF